MKEILKIILNISLKILKPKWSFLTNQIRNSTIRQTDAIDAKMTNKPKNFKNKSVLFKPKKSN